MPRERRQDAAATAGEDAGGTLVMSHADDMPRNALGTVLMVLGIAMLVYDSTQDWDTIWATAAGIKFIVVGVIFLIWGPLKRLDQSNRNTT